MKENYIEFKPKKDMIKLKFKKKENKNMLEIYAIKDTKVGEFQNPFYQRSKGEAIRSITAAVNDETPGNHYNKFYNDYELWKLGEYDQKTGTIKSELTHVLNCAEVKEA